MLIPVLCDMCCFVFQYDSSGHNTQRSQTSSRNEGDINTSQRRQVGGHTDIYMLTAFTCSNYVVAIKLVYCVLLWLVCLFSLDLVQGLI